eukprot:12399618-Karenia_brevis.AAC.1
MVNDSFKRSGDTGDINYIILHFHPHLSMLMTQQGNHFVLSVLDTQNYRTQDVYVMNPRLTWGGGE